MYKKRLSKTTSSVRRSPRASSPKAFSPKAFPSKIKSPKSPARKALSPKTTQRKKRSPSPKKKMSRVSPRKTSAPVAAASRYSFSRPPPIPLSSSPSSFVLSAASTATTSRGGHHHQQQLERRIKSSRIVIFGRSDCGWCRKAKEMFDEMKAQYTFVDIYDPKDNFSREEMVILNEMTSPTETVPRIFVDGVFMGGYADTADKIKNGKIKI